MKLAVPARLKMIVLGVALAGASACASPTPQGDFPVAIRPDLPTGVDAAPSDVVRGPFEICELDADAGAGTACPNSPVTSCPPGCHLITV